MISIKAVDIFLKLIFRKLYMFVYVKDINLNMAVIILLDTWESQNVYALVPACYCGGLG